MATKAQLNPSTLKVLFNPVTKNVQMAVAATPGECEFCDEAPVRDEIEVTFHDVAICPCQAYLSGSWKSEWITDLNTSWLLTRTGPTSCVWRYAQTYSDPKVLREKYYYSPGCATQNQSGQWEYWVKIELEKISVDTVRLRVWLGSGYLVAFYGPYQFDGTKVIDDGCVEVNGIINTAESCTPHSSFSHMTSGGTADVVEL